MNTVRLSELLHLDGSCLSFKRLSGFLPKMGGADVRNRRADLHLEKCFKEEKQEEERSGPLCLYSFFMSPFSDSGLNQLGCRMIYSFT